MSSNPGGIGDGGGSAAPNVYSPGLTGVIRWEKFLEPPERGDSVEFVGGAGSACIGGGPGVGGRTRVPSFNEDDRGSVRTVSWIFISLN